MSLKTAILDTGPTSYWPLDDDVGGSCHDEVGLHNATISGAGVKLADVAELLNKLKNEAKVI